MQTFTTVRLLLRFGLVKVLDRSCGDFACLFSILRHVGLWTGDQISMNRSVSMGSPVVILIRRMFSNVIHSGLEVGTGMGVLETMSSPIAFLNDRWADSSCFENPLSVWTSSCRAPHLSGQKQAPPFCVAGPKMQKKGSSRCDQNQEYEPTWVQNVPCRSCISFCDAQVRQCGGCPPRICQEDMQDDARLFFCGTQDLWCVHQVLLKSGYSTQPCLRGLWNRAAQHVIKN